MEQVSPFPQGRSAVRNGSLYINNTEDGDGGVYICTATNKHGMIIHGTFLKVESVGKPYYIFSGELINSGALAARRAAKRSPIVI